ncbi:MAG TPA: single-stranded DNA-binding protein [Spirochaetota bacterium]|nr:single-stranded DNA-binding protein [Spirochaetota bacterium]HPC43358.1 single-stranded DNA-binding protein [Spirochaetota bacterium]HPL16233.1 single-stranded DNA-binding protein [Spirochaetota bacterium]HQF08408.1 single-stranded DNA-binding protein [Spirochaetota bacterium]HQH99045.1 single-stranded DNA-binding protein [Spirochaetota bacterium]
MASDLNKAILIGRLTRDPELRYTQSGTSVCSFSIANNRTYVAGGEKKEQVSYFNCVAWAKTGEVIAEYCKKGKRIGIEGRLQQRSYDDKDGNKRQIVEIVVDNFQFLDAPGGGGKEAPMDMPSSSSEPSSSNTDNPFSDEDIPF